MTPDLSSLFGIDPAQIQGMQDQTDQSVTEQAQPPVNIMQALGQTQPTTQPTTLERATTAVTRALERPKDNISPTQPLEQAVKGTTGSKDLLKIGRDAFALEEMFSKQYREGVSPGREFLANLMFGLASGHSGQKFIPAREQARAKWMESMKLLDAEQRYEDLNTRFAQTSAQKDRFEADKNALAAGIALMRNAEAIRRNDIRKQVADYMEDFRNGQIDHMQLQEKNFETQKKLMQAQTENLQARTDEVGRPKTRDQMISEWQATLAQADDAKEQGDKETFDALTKKADFLQKGINESIRAGKATKNEPQGPRALMWVPDGKGGYTAQEARSGTVVPPGAVTAQGVNAANTPTTMTRNMMEKAPKVAELADTVDQIVSRIENRLGPGKSRLAYLKAQKIGLKDPDFKELQDNGKLLSSLLTNMHVGNRPAEKISEQFIQMIGTSYQDPENMHRTMRVIKNYANLVMHSVASGRINESNPYEIQTVFDEAEKAVEWERDSNGKLVRKK